MTSKRQRVTSSSAGGAPAEVTGTWRKRPAIIFDSAAAAGSSALTV